MVVTDNVINVDAWYDVKGTQYHFGDVIQYITFKTQYYVVIILVLGVMA